MHSPNLNASDLKSAELNLELQYNIVEMAAIVACNVPLTNEEQTTVSCLQFWQDKVNIFLNVSG